MRLATAKKQFFPNPLRRLFGRETVVGADWSVSEKLFLRFGAFSVRGTDEMDESAVWRTQNEMKITIASECRAKREGVWGMCPRIRSRRLRRLLVQNKLGLGQAYFVPGAATELSLITRGCSVFFCYNELVHCQTIDILVGVFTSKLRKARPNAPAF